MRRAKERGQREDRGNPGGDRRADVEGEAKKKRRRASYRGKEQPGD